MMEEGEPFTQEEMDEMWPVAIDPISGHIPYEFYLNQLMVAMAYSSKELKANLFLIFYFRFICKRNGMESFPLNGVPSFE